MSFFALATLLPFALTVMAALHGGAWGWLALSAMTVLVVVLDRLTARHTRNADPAAEFPAATPLLIVLGIMHLLLLALIVRSSGGNTGLDTSEKLLAGIAAGMIFGQISHPVAHELIHRPARGPRLLGRVIYTSLLVGHHASAHLRVHHVHVGTENDPSSARLGEGFYRFALRAAPGAFMAGLRAESRLRAKVEAARRRPHPYVFHVGGAILTVIAALLLGGLVGAGVLVAVSLYAQIQMLLSDYVQHYGLRRRARPDGTPEPVGPQHSWNAPFRYSSALTLNAPRHSDHHVAPSRPYPALRFNAEMPVLPASVPVMAVVALVPPLWRRIMDPRCERLSGARNFATRGRGMKNRLA